MTYYQQLKHREEKCIIAGINASDPAMMRMWQENALELEIKRREVEKTECADGMHKSYHFFLKPRSLFNIYRENEFFDKMTNKYLGKKYNKKIVKIDMSRYIKEQLKILKYPEIEKLFPKSGKIIAEALNDEVK